MQTPYLSIITTSRNDNHGEQMRLRMQLFMNGLLEQTRRHQVPVELIIVEWNPPLERPLLHEVLPGPIENDLLNVRYIIVPNELHRQYKQADELPLFQMIAKNVGIRRAIGEFILCTNVDLLFSDELFKIFAKKNLRKDTFYRCDRCDIPAEIQSHWNLDEQLEYAKNNIIKRQKNQRYLGLMQHLAGMNRKRLRQLGSKLPGILLSQLETYACGDFTLMHRDVWMDIQGYPELDLYSIHVDSMGLYAAAALGYRQVIFPPEACTYHIYHKNGWESMTSREKVHFCEKKPCLGWDIAYKFGLEIIREGKRYNINAPDWGFAREKLQEIVLLPAKVPEAVA